MRSFWTDRSAGVRSCPIVSHPQVVGDPMASERARGIRLRAVVVGGIAAGIVMALLLPSPPAEAGDCKGKGPNWENYWNGAWNTHHHGTELMELKLKQKPCEREITGTYNHPNDKNGDKGTIEATAKGKNGKTLNGSYTSTKKKGGGGFTLEISRSTTDFTGTFWPCRFSFLCGEINWEGEHHGA